MRGNFLSLRNTASFRSHIGEIKDISFDIRKGECLALSGRTYSGVKELFAILSLRKEYKGYVLLHNGKQLSECHSSYEAGIIPIDQRVRQSVSSGTLLDSLVVISGQQKIYSVVDENETIERFRKMIEDLGLDFRGEYLSRRVRDLTRVELIEFAILYVVYADAGCIILENPFQGLNYEEIERLKNILKRVKRRNISVLYVSDEHFDQLEELIDRVIVLRHGRVSYVLYPEKEDKRFDRQKLKLAMDGKRENRKGAIIQKKELSGLNLKIRKDDRELSFSSGDRVGIYDPGMNIPSQYKELASYLNKNCEIQKNDKLLDFSSDRSFLDNRIVVILKDPEREIFMNLSPVENVTMISGRRNSTILTNNRIDRYIYRETAEKYSYLKSCLSVINESNCYRIPAILRKELSVAKGLSLDPDIIIFFDLEDSYQPAEQEQSAELIRQLSAEGKIVISVSSNLDFLEKTSEIIIS